MKNNIDTEALKDKKLLSHFISTDKTLEKFDVSAKIGLGEDEVLKRRAENGKNELPGKKVISLWSIILSQFKSPLYTYCLQQVRYRL